MPVGMSGVGVDGCVIVGGCGAWECVRNSVRGVRELEPVLLGDGGGRSQNDGGKVSGRWVSRGLYLCLYIIKFFLFFNLYFQILCVEHVLFTQHKSTSIVE